MTLEQILNEFYAKEQNVSISSFWDGRWDFLIGDEMNRWKSGTYGVTVAEGTAWLCAKYQEMYGGGDESK